MLKNFLKCSLITSAIILGAVFLSYFPIMADYGIISQAEARDVYAGSYEDTDIYVITETARVSDKGCTGKLKVVRDSDSFISSVIFKRYWKNGYLEWTVSINGDQPERYVQGEDDLLDNVYNLFIKYGTE